MGVLEELMQLKNQGISDKEIVGTLQQQGFSPREIGEAFNQVQIKGAVSNVPQSPDSITPPKIQEDYYAPTQTPVQTNYTQEQAQPETAEYYQNQENYEGEAYPTGFDANTIIEISEQVFNEKSKEIKKKLRELNEFKAISEMKLNNIDERLKKIENMIDLLQSAILEKIGSYGSTLEGVKKEMSMMQDSFGKVVENAVKGAKKSSKKD
jgi:DNA-binding transcriptional MerR regulator